MFCRVFLCALLLFFNIFCLFSQGHEQGYSPQTIRGEVYTDFEPIYGIHVDKEYPLSASAAGRRALEEAAIFYSAMIYGWSFYYEIGERARQISEKLDLEPVGIIQFGDPGLRVTDVEVRDGRLRVWTDYHLTAAQQRRMSVWRTGTISSAQAVGHSPAGDMEEYPGWLAVKHAALEDAARIALRTALRGNERNRPKEVTGFISLASFPHYYVISGRWAVNARFRFQITEIIPFAAY